MNNAICTVAAAPLRKEDAHRSEMTSQILFGETMQILEQKGEWFRVKTDFDGYEGWLTYHLIEEFTGVSDKRFVAAGLINVVGIDKGTLHVPMGAALTHFDTKTLKLWDSRYRYEGEVRDTGKGFDMDFFRRCYYSWLHVPYLWGGRTLMGVDCSGFVQTVYKLMGINLKRDAYLQADQGEAVNNLADAKEGDLAFFNNEAGRITHVGLLLNEKEIIHASGKVRLDDIDSKQITSRETGKKTHDLHSIRRFLF